MFFRVFQNEKNEIRSVQFKKLNAMMKIRVQKLIKKCQKSQKTSKNVIFRDFHHFYRTDKNHVFNGLRFHGFFRISRVKKQKITKNHEKTRDFFRVKN